MLNFTCRIDNELYAQLIEIADEKDRSLIGIIREALWEYVHKDEEQKEISTYENAMMWLDARLRDDYFSGMHADGIQALVDDIKPLMQLLHTERREGSNVIRCGQLWGSNTKCFLYKAHFGQHRAFSDAGRLCEWEDKNNDIAAQASVR